MRNSSKQASTNIASFMALTFFFFALVSFSYLRKQTPTRQNPQKDPYSHYKLALRYAEQNRFGEARDAYHRSLSLKPDFLEARLNLGLLYHKNNQLNEAVTQYLDVIGRNPRYALAHYNLGVAYYQQGLIDDATTAYRRALEADPSHADSHYNLGYLYAHHTEWQDKALEHLRKAIAIKPAFVKAHYEIGLLHESRGLASQAKAAWEAALAIAPDYGPARTKLNPVQ